MTKFFVTMFVFFAALCGNAMAQDAGTEPDVGTSADVGTDASLTFDYGSTQIQTQTTTATADTSDATNQPDADQQPPDGGVTLAQCEANLLDCRNKLQAQTNSSTSLLFQLAQRRGYASTDDMLSADCRDRRGIWRNDDCECDSQWSGTTEHPKQCCVTNLHAYERRQNACNSDGDDWVHGDWSCRGGCRCPYGTALDANDHCQGSAASREEVIRMRARIQELETQQTNLQTALNTAQSNGTAQASQIVDLTSQLRAVTSEANDLRDELARAEAPTTAPGTTGTSPLAPPAPLPGTAESVAAAAGGTNPLAPTPPPPEAEEGNWCGDNPGWCTLVIIGAGAAVAGATVGAVEATRDIRVTQ